MSTFTYTGRQKVTAVQMADDTVATLAAMIGTRDGADMGFSYDEAPLVTAGYERLGRDDSPRTLVLSWEASRTGRRYTMREGDLLLVLDDHPYDYAVMSAEMFGALFKTGE